jgi:hypothetical protein
LLSKTIQNVQTQMRANRNEQAAIILGNLKCDLIDYPLPLGLLDIEAYYRAGTFTAGLITLADTVSKAESDSKLKKDIQNPTPPPGAIAQVLSDMDVKAAQFVASQKCVPAARQISFVGGGGAVPPKPSKPAPPPPPPPPRIETDADVTAILRAFVDSGAIQKANLANLLLIPTIKNLPEIKAAGTGLTIDDVLSQPQFASVRRQLLGIERRTKLIP